MVIYNYYYDNDTGLLYRITIEKNKKECFNWKTKIWENVSISLQNKPLVVRISEKEMLRLTEEDSIYTK